MEMNAYLGYLFFLLFGLWGGSAIALSATSYMKKINHVEEPAEKEVRDGINKSKLKELRAFLRAGDREPVEDLIRDIDRYSYGDIDTEFFTALKEYVGTGDYQTSSEMIDQYLNSI